MFYTFIFFGTTCGGKVLFHSFLRENIDLSVQQNEMKILLFRLEEMDKNWVLRRTLSEALSDEIQVPEQQIRKVVNLFNDGCEVAYIARYRADAHGGMTCEQIRRSMDIFNETIKLNDVVGKAINNVGKKISDVNELRLVEERLRNCTDNMEVKEVVQVYQSTRKTKAVMARELGMGEVCDKILNGGQVNLRTLVKPKEKGLQTLENVEEQLRICMADSIQRMPETQDELVKIASLKVRCNSFILCGLSSKSKKLKENDDGYQEVKRFEAYTNFKRRIDIVENFQVLAMERGQECGILAWGLDLPNPESLHPFKNKMWQSIAPAHRELVESSFQLSVAKHFVPKIERYLKRFLLKRAHLAAIECFANNIGQLFSQRSLKAAAIIALDPGFSACKAAFLTGDGGYRDSCDFYLKGKQFREDSTEKMIKWTKQAGSNIVVAIGNGKASYETQTAVSELIKKKVFGSKSVKFCVVSECGASKYSITPLAEEEFPELKPNHRSAVSIGRRLVDPMAEYVKIEPQHLGMGMYQHSINEKQLATALQQIVREKISLRGVDVNRASLQLLQHVSGLNKKTATGIVTLREKQGRICSREQLKSIAGIGAKTFEQCAGFLFIDKDSNESSEGPARKKVKMSYNPLDNTCVHPTLYEVTENLLRKANVQPSELGLSSAKEKLTAFKNTTGLLDEEKQVLELLDVHIPTIPAPTLLEDVRQMTSLKTGEVITGRVQNQCDFGLFVDIGVGQNALMHRSKLRGDIPEVGREIKVMIDNVDVGRKRIGIVPCY